MVSQGGERKKLSENSTGYRYSIPFKLSTKTTQDQVVSKLLEKNDCFYVFLAANHSKYSTI